MRWIGGIFGGLINNVMAWWNFQQGRAFRCSSCKTIQSNGFKLDDGTPLTNSKGKWECVTCAHEKGKLRKKK